MPDGSISITETATNTPLNLYFRWYDPKGGSTQKIPMSTAVLDFKIVIKPKIKHQSTGIGLSQRNRLNPSLDPSCSLWTEAWYRRNNS